MKIIRRIHRVYSWLRSYINYFKALKQVSQRNVTDRTIVINSIRRMPFVINRELFIGFVLAKQGAKVIVLFDDGVLEHWDTDKSKYHASGERPLIQDAATLKAILYKLKLLLESVARATIHKVEYGLLLNCYRHPNITILYYSQLVDKEKIVVQEKCSFDGFDIDCAEFALQSTKKYFENSEVDLSIPVVRDYYEKALVNSNISLAAGEYIAEVIEPDVFFTSHGIYSIWGPCYEHLFNRDFRTIVWGGDTNYTDRIRMITTKDQQSPYSIEWKEYSSTPVTKEMKELVGRFMKSRTEFKMADTRVIYRHVRENTDFKRPENGRLVACAFSNVCWDGDIKERNLAFRSLIDWLEKTVEYFLSGDSMVLFIKAHPSELVLESGFEGGSYPVLEILNRRFSDLERQENIRLIPADAGINTYEFVRENVDVGLVYDGHLCVELPYLGVPTIVVGNGRFSEKSVNYCVSSYEEYIDLLNNIEDIIADFHKDYDRVFENLVRFCYWDFKVTSFSLPTLDKGDIHSLSHLTVNDIDIAKNPDFKRTIERILGPIEL